MTVRDRIERRLGNLSDAQLLELERELERFEPAPVSLELLRARRAEILGIAASHGATNIRLFGSVARDAVTPESDIDLLVDLENDRSLLDRIAVAQDLIDLLGRKVDIVDSRSLHPIVRDQVLAEAVGL